jgi:catechol 2,3-dioxygenase-like lactoylglutathione lyase family enzyme
MKIIKSLHTAILVSDLEKAEYFYSNVLGLSRIDRTLKYPGIWYQIGDYQLHLIVDPNFQLQRQNPEKWGRNPHIAFATDNLEDLKNYLESLGYPLQMSASGRAALFVGDPDGNMLEISQN